VKRQIRRLEEPSLRCVELVHEEMQRMIQHCGTQQEMLRFPKLHERIVDVVTNVLRQRLPTTNAMVENLVQIELAYINTGHPDFSEAHLFHRAMVTATDPFDMSRGSHSQRSLDTQSQRGSEEKENKQQRASSQKRPDIHQTEGSATNMADKSSSSSSCQYLSDLSGRCSATLFKAPGQLVDSMNQMNGGNSWKISNLIRSNQLDQRGGASDRGIEPASSLPSSAHSSAQPSPAHMQRPGGINLLPEVPEQPMMKLSNREQSDCEIIERLIKSYFMIVRKNIQDSTPKAIMHFLVNFVKDHLQSELVSTLYRKEEIETLLEESSHIAARRKEASEMLQALQRASQIIGEIREIHLW